MGITAKQVTKKTISPKEIVSTVKDEVKALGCALASWRVGFIDIESTGLSADFGHILGVCIKPSDSKVIQEFRIDNYPGYRKDLCNDRPLVLDVKEAMGAYDVLVHYNGNNFDMPFIDTRLAVWGESRSPLVHSIDLFPIVKQKLRLHSNRLDSLATALSLKHSKTRLEPMTWQKASHGSKPDLDYIMEHCRMDVLVLEEAFIRLKGFIDTIFRRR